MVRCVPAALRMLSVFVFAASGAALGCASWRSDFQRSPDGTLVHRELGFQIGTPAPVDGVGWERESVDDTVLSYRYQALGDGTEGRGATSLVMMVDCSEFGMAAQLEARNLRLGLEGAAIQYSGPVSHLGYSGWGQRFETRVGAHAVHVAAVTLVVDGCTYDWLIVTPLDSPPLFQAFEAWWTSFVPGPRRPDAGRHADAAGADTG